MTIRWAVLPAAIIISLVFVAPAFSGNRFLIAPQIDTSYRIDSNFYSDETGERSVSTLTISPGLGIGFETEKSNIEALGILSFNYYDDLDAVPAGMTSSDENDYTGYNLKLSADTMLFTRITTGLKGVMIQTRNPEERDELGNFIDTEEYRVSRFNPWVKYQITQRISAGLEANTTGIDYTADTQEDSFLFQVRGRLYYELTKLTTVDLEYAQEKMDYDMYSWDYTSMRYGTNVVSHFKYFELGAGIGYHTRDFDETGAEDLNTPYWHVTIKGQNPPTLGRDEKPRSYMTLSFNQDFNDSGDNNEYYQADRVSLILGHLFMEKIDVQLKGYYQKSDYENSYYYANREDDTFFLSGKTAYFLNRRFTLNLETGIESRDSSIAGYDYDNSFAMFTLTFNYDLGNR